MNSAAIGRRPRRVVIVAFDGCQALDVTGPFEVFAQARDRLPAAPGGAGYEVLLASPAGGDVASNSGLRWSAALPLSAFAPGSIDTLIVAGARREAIDALLHDAAFIGWLRRHAPRTRRICSVCTGAFALAAAGLLDGRRATTHWESCARLARLHPALHVEPDAIFVADPPCFTSAGISAGIDLALALVEADHGRRLALAIARELVLFLRRPGGQSQFSAGLEAQAAAGHRFAELVAWIVEHPQADLRVQALAARAGVSARHFARLFRQQTAQTPARFVEAVRIERAKGHLEDADWPLKRLAGQCGFGSVDGLNRAFRRCVGITPGAYRERFAALAPDCAQAAD